MSVSGGNNNLRLWAKFKRKLRFLNKVAYHNPRPKGLLLRAKGDRVADTVVDNDTVRASRGGHTYHERWAARRALQLVFPNDNLYAIAVEGVSPTEKNSPGKSGEEVADLVFYYGLGDNFVSCERLETVQFKYMVQPTPVTAAFLKKTIEKFAETILGYESGASAEEVDAKSSFMFVTNAEFNDNLWSAISSLIDGTTPADSGAATQARNLRKWCLAKGLTDPKRLFVRTVFKAGEKGLAAQDNALKRTLTDWSAGSDSEARLRLYALQDLIIKKAGPSGQGKNLIRREDVLDALDCEPEDLFPADTRFIDVGVVIEREEIADARKLLIQGLPVFVHAEGGVGKTVFIQSLAAKIDDQYEVVVFDCFGGGAYRSDNHSRHLPRIGLVQIVNELASRTLCDPLLPGSDDRRRIIKAAVRRLKQAVLAIKTQSKKRGLLVIIDAADNAQLEADHRHEDAFPKYLLSALNEEPVDGVNLLLTARTHRRASVICGARVNEIELGPFTEHDARDFLKHRKPDASSIEVTTALARSGRNARVLDYLVSSWEANVAGKGSDAPITVSEIIKQRCDKIIADLRIAGWPDSDVAEFFVALSLLPPPIPLAELAGALGWSISQVKTAASDLAPMLEITPPHGAMFRDEPTETYVRETYEGHFEAQRQIADRLISSQSSSMYAAEALPHFLVVIKDSERAFALVDSTMFPSTVQSDFGRRRLILARLWAAFRLAVANEDFDKILGLSMRLAQAATADMRGDEFIRRAPGLAVVLGDTDSYRRLFADRSGWRGARSARLTIAHHFADDANEAQIHCDSTTRWINWHAEQPQEEQGNTRQPSPDVHDYTAILFHKCLEGDFKNVDRNLARWSNSFSILATSELLKLLALFDSAKGRNITAQLISFVASKECTSEALTLKILSRAQALTPKQTRAVAKRLQTAKLESRVENEDFSTEREGGISVDIIKGGLSSLFKASRTSAEAISRKADVQRPAAYDYGERWGHSNAWAPIRAACLRAWSTRRSVAYYDLLPREVKLSKKAKAVADRKSLLVFLAELRKPASSHRAQQTRKKEDVEKFNRQEREEIADGIEIALNLIRPIEDAALSGRVLKDTDIDVFLNIWTGHLQKIQWKHQRPVDLLARTVGFGCLHILLDFANSITAAQAETIVELVSSGRFQVTQQTEILAHFSRRNGLEQLTGIFAKKIVEQIRQDDDIGQRGNIYSGLAEVLVPLSVNEAREYYRQGLAQLDQMGGDNYDQIYSLLHFASTQRGGYLKPALAQRLMNLCQTIVSSEPSKFGWTLFARAAAKSIGLPAIAKIVRWDNQEVAEFSYGLPQLACFLAEAGQLDPRRAAFILTICEDHGWWDWKSGEAVAELLRLSPPSDQRRIFRAVIEKLQLEHPFGGWPSLWDSYLEIGKQFPNVITSSDIEAVQKLRTEAQHKQDERNKYNSSSPAQLIGVRPRLSEEDVEKIIDGLVKASDPVTANSIDDALKKIQTDQNLHYSVRQRFLNAMEVNCLYNSRIEYLFSVCDASELSLSQSQSILTRCVSAWRNSSTHLVSSLKDLTERLIANKGNEIFEGQFSNVARTIRAASDFCGDARFVMQLVLKKIVADEVELDGNEWLQLATALCDLASPDAGLKALEVLLAGPTSRIADEGGEGPYQPTMAIDGDEASFLADVSWHLLGDEDAYIRWAAARGLKTLVDLGLPDDLGRLLRRFDQKSIAALKSESNDLSFQNSQQWLLMGLARASATHGVALANLRPKLVELSRRDDIHVIHKVHIARILTNTGTAVPDLESESLLLAIDNPPCGIVTSNAHPTASSKTSNFSFDYEFSKTEIDKAARLFNLPRTVVEDAMGMEIERIWPEAKSMDFFEGRERYRWDLEDRYEFFREHVQRHALLSAVTKLSRSHPVVIKSYETHETSPWLDWRRRYDVTFDDGTWLSDRKDKVPDQAKYSLMGKTLNQQETLLDQDTILRALGIFSNDEDALIPLYGRWTSPDSVDVRITSALSLRKGAISRCHVFSRLPAHDFWLPEFWEDGYYDKSYRSDNPFEPFVWSPETHRLGIDNGDKLAAKSALGRPRLGIEMTKKLAIAEDHNSGCWRTTAGVDALRSQVWGSWQPDPDQHRARLQEDGEILWASPQWLGEALSTLRRQLVFTVTLWKYKSSRSYQELSGVKAVYVGLRMADGKLRLWQAKNAAKVSSSF